MDIEPGLSPVELSNTIAAVGRGAHSKPAMSTDGVVGCPDEPICSGDNSAKSNLGIQGNDGLNVHAHTSSTFSSKSGSVLTQQSTFDSFLPIWTLTQEITTKCGMKPSNIIRRTSESFSEQRSLELFGTKEFMPPTCADHHFSSFRTPKRGYFGCSSSGCLFKIPFLYSTRAGSKYIVNSEPCLIHNHPPTGTNLDGCTEVKDRADLHPVEIEKLNTLAISSIGMAQIKESMFLHFPTRDFCTNLLYREVERELDRKFGCNRDQMVQLMEKGHQNVLNGGVWEPIIGPTMHVDGCHYQTASQKLYADQYGGYYYTADGTHDTNKYGYICVPCVAPDCLGLSHPLGVGVHKSENGTDINRSLKLFRLSSIPDDVNGPEVPSSIEGITLNNRVQQNSHGGHMATDEAPWSFQTAKDNGKTHGLCCKHKANGVLKSCSGLRGSAQAYMDDMNDIIYGIFPSVEVLDENIRDARKKYGCNSSSLDFINSVDHNKALICGTIMQYEFTVGHCTSSIGESWHARMKGHGELKKYLRTANLFTLINVIDRMSRAQDIVAVKILKDLRELNMRWSFFFQKHYDQYKMLAGTNILEVKVHEDEAQQNSSTVWHVVDIDGHESKVNLATRIVHRGHIYTIPTCTCGKWCSLFVWCPCIIRAAALVPAFTLDDAHNVHPFHLIQLHPMWGQALKELNNVENYNDFPHLAQQSVVHLSSSPTLSHECDLVVTQSNAQPAVATDSTNTQAIMPSRFYNQFDSLPVKNSVRVNKLRALCADIISAAVTRGNDTGYRIAHCRMSQALSECEGNVLPGHTSVGTAVTPRAPPTINKKRVSNDVLANKSSLNIGMRTACGTSKCSKPRKKAKISDSNYHHYTKKELKLILKSIQRPVGGNVTQLRSRLNENKKARELGVMSLEELQAKCAESGLNSQGNSLSIILRLLYDHYGTAPREDSAVIAALAPAIVYIDTDPPQMDDPKITKATKAVASSVVAIDTEQTIEVASIVGTQPESTRKSPPELINLKKSIDDDLSDREFTRAVYLRTGFNINPTGDPMTAEERRVRASHGDSLVSIFPGKYGPREDEADEVIVDPMSESDIEQYKSDLYALGDQRCSTLTYQQFVDTSGWMTIHAGLGTNEADPHYSQKYPVWKEWLIHQRQVCRRNSSAK